MHYENGADDNNVSYDDFQTSGPQYIYIQLFYNLEIIIII